tara:strand:+ start:27 stop:185 length:159 start_codon:yes stop_codon:yes gene_type:complete
MFPINDCKRRLPSIFVSLVLISLEKPLDIEDTIIRAHTPKAIPIKEIIDVYL